MKRMLRMKDKKGQGLVEYALIIGAVALVVVLALSAIPGPINDILAVVTDALGIAP